MTEETQMLYIGGSKTSYRCECGANVFKKVSEHIWRCNACNALHSDLTDADLDSDKIVHLNKKSTADLWVKIYQYLNQSTILDPMAALKVTNDIIELVEENKRV